MSKQISLTLSGELMQQADVFRRAFRPAGCRCAIEAIEASLDPIVLPRADVRPPAEWSDAQVLAAADSVTPPGQDRRLTKLLDRQQAQSLTQEQRTELSALMQVYQAGLLHKAQCIAEAVRRGLRPAPLP